MAPTPATIEERPVDFSTEIIQKNPKKRWVSYIWDTFDKSPEERRLLFKLDAAILTFASLGELIWIADWIGGISNDNQGYFIKYLDQVNINNAFVSGMCVLPELAAERRVAD